jgi:hypothetical protein
MTGTPLNGPVIASAVTPRARVAPDQPVVGIALDPGGTGYWLVASDAGIVAFAASFRGSVPAVLAPGETLNRPVVGTFAYSNGYLMVEATAASSPSRTSPFWGHLWEPAREPNRRCGDLAGVTEGGHRRDGRVNRNRTLSRP